MPECSKGHSCGCREGENRTPSVPPLDYQAGSIVSRTVIDKQAGTVTLFAFDEGQGLSEHKAPYDALVQVMEGEAEIRIGKENHDLKQGELIVMPAGVPHAVRAKTRFKMMLVMIRA